MGFWDGGNTSLMLKKATLFLKLGTMRVVCCLSLVLPPPPPSGSLLSFPYFEPATGVERCGIILLHGHLPVLTWKYVHDLCDIHSRFRGVLCYYFYKLLCSYFGLFFRSIALSANLLFLSTFFSSLYSASARVSLSFISSSIYLCDYYAFDFPLALTNTLLLTLRDAPMSFCLAPLVVIIGVSYPFHTAQGGFFLLPFAPYSGRLSAVSASLGVWRRWQKWLSGIR